ncbi:MAG: alpha/beta hydrolase [Proteobacteria bacterium]|nr:alpha/beta hydrolase [Pseudomonadota bacterium]
MRVTFVDVDGVNTRYLSEGDPSNYPLMLIHGFGGCADLFIRNIDVLADEFYVIAPDMIAHGFTGPDDFEGKPPHPKHVGHLLKLADALGLGNFCACGSSYGALIAALMYFERPQQVNKLIINGSGSCFNSEEELASALQGAKNNALTAMRAATYESCRKRTQNIVYDGSAVPEAILLPQLTSYAFPHMVPKYEEAMNGMMDIPASRPYRILERLDQLDVDTLVAWGREDPRGVYANAVEASKKMPRATLETFEKCGHLPFLEHPEQWNTAVRTFLKS